MIMDKYGTNQSRDQSMYLKHSYRKLEKEVFISDHREHVFVKFSMTTNPSKVLKQAIERSVFMVFDNQLELLVPIKFRLELLRTNQVPTSIATHQSRFQLELLRTNRGSNLIATYQSSNLNCYVPKFQLELLHTKVPT